MMFNVLIFLTTVTLSYLIWDYCQKVLFTKSLNNLPGPINLPFIGSYYILWNRNDFLETLTRLTENYSSPFQSWIGNKLFIVIYEPDDAKTILHSENCMDKSIIYKLFEPCLGSGLVTAPASIWSQMRKMSERTFSLHMIKKFFNISFEHAVKFAQKLEKSGLNKNEIDLYKYINNCTWKIACGKII
ncbi:cytochrome P450 4g15-like [Cardiocondyla obscurior]|uniref:cytochrome P450 4g15-like n=1 Tax=Cardiocondyla obscurior TaxID=286306 RepID=UPI0039655CF7